MQSRYHDVGAEHSRSRQRPKSDILIPHRSSSSPLYSIRNSPLTPTFNRELSNPPKTLKHLFSAYSLACSSSHPRRASIMEMDTAPKAPLPELTPKDLMDYFNLHNDLRKHPGTRSLPEQYRYIYPSSLLQSSEITSLQAHIAHPSIRPLWLRWMEEIRFLVSEWERAVGMMGKEVERYLMLSESEKQLYKRIDELNSSSIQGVNQFIEMHLDRAIRIVSKVPVFEGLEGTNLNPNMSKFPELTVEFENLKAKYANLQEERRKWTRLKLGYNY